MSGPTSRRWFGEPKSDDGSRSILILPDMLPADDFRRLRLLMRHSRSEVDAISFASHA